MTSVQTIHYKDETGEQLTTRVVVLTDAAGTEYEYEFEVTGDDRDLDAHEYVGEGDPSDRALDALEAFLSEGASDE